MPFPLTLSFRHSKSAIHLPESENSSSHSPSFASSPPVPPKTTPLSALHPPLQQQQNVKDSEDNLFVTPPSRAATNWAPSGYPSDVPTLFSSSSFPSSAPTHRSHVRGCRDTASDICTSPPSPASASTHRLRSFTSSQNVRGDPGPALDIRRFDSQELRDYIALLERRHKVERKLLEQEINALRALVFGDRVIQI
ncbi:hypothetical protein GYMLUDRAFT_251229 [Collybiopsis luxurians FD-317 M1]|uniref:Uncharacterized protein n=1 Tax=Collybiopsis luxurians FD-317 M1 TaxID=944289 RepID=A0A0D0BRZ4_9AGAR|nr:hypothetical protein GYMLUDRAFT_251229 [Collybiopsis luxurians FD-317 M1]